MALQNKFLYAFRRRVTQQMGRRAVADADAAHTRDADDAEANLLAIYFYLGHLIHLLVGRRASIASVNSLLTVGIHYFAAPSRTYFAVAAVLATVIH